MNDALRWIMRDEIKAGWQQGIQQGMQRGMLQGKQQQAKDTALKLHDMGLPVDKIAKAVDVSIDTVQKWLAEQSALVLSPCPTRLQRELRQPESPMANT